jgi:hypothetical protein
MTVVLLMTVVLPVTMARLTSSAKIKMKMQVATAKPRNRMAVKEIS